MSEPTPREALREKILTILGNHFYDAGYDGTVDDVEQLIDAEVLAVLNELEKNTYRALYEDSPEFIPLSDITQLKQRYGGKEQK